MKRYSYYTKDISAKKSYKFFMRVIFAFVLILIAGKNISFAQITQPTAWTKAYDGTANIMTGVSVPIAAGSNRILIVGISHTLNGSATQADPTTITYGGVTLTLATTNGATSGRMHTWFYYLKDNAVMDGSSQPLNVTLPGTTHLNVTVWYSVFANVDQSPVSYTVGNGINNSSGSGPAQLSAAMAVNANQQAIYMSCVYSNTTTAPGYTKNANWTIMGTNSGTNNVSWKYDLANRAIPGANTTDNAATSAITPASQIRYAISAMSLPAIVGTPVLTLSNPTTSIGAASVCASSLKVPVHAFNITGSVTAGTLTNFQFTTTGTYVAGDITNFKIWWNSTNNIGTATTLATNSTPAGPGVQTFSAFSLNIPSGSTYYFWITADIAASAVTGHTLTVSGSNSPDMTTTATKSGGPTAASGVQTLNSAPTIVTVTGGGTYCGGTTTLNASGGTGGTIYWQGTTPNGTSTLTPSVSQTISASGTYYFRAYDGTTCWGPDGSALVTITTVPTTVTVSGGGTFCGSTTLTANGGTGGTIYWQNTTSGGTSTATPSSSQVVSASGTYYFRALNGTCWGPEGSATVVINTLPTAVTVTGGGTFCSVPNVTLNASGGTGGTIYWQNTTTNGTSTATPSISQTVSSSGTYYFRAQTAAGCWGTQGSATVTMGTTPTAVTVSGGGTFCGTSATLTASGGVGGTMYWQNTTSNGTSTASPSSSQTVVASGTYYFRALNGTCWSTQGSATVTINPVPTITLGTNPSVCSGTTSTNLTYSATAGTPNQYSIVYDAAALAQGFVNVTNAALPLSPIALLVPASAAAGIYNLTVTVRNSTTGCVSNNYAKTVTIIAIPATPGIISGSTNPAPGTTGLVYSISPVSGATSYIWSVPTGWTITAGGGSTSITVTSGVGGQNGNITVQATNSCSTSAASSLSVAVAVPHNNCNQCHINHNSYGTALAIVSGNANLCISCHNTSGTASANPFSNAMKAVPGTSGTSHTWDATAVNYKDGANLPTDAGMLARMDGGKILCSTCHNQHSNTFSPFLRVSNDGDAMCKQCHSVRNVGRYIDNPSVNIGSHPVGVTYNGLDARFLSTPSSSTPLVNAKVECSSCHKTHYAASSDGYALRMTYTDAICKSCHVWKSSRRSLDHEGMGCITCHIAHKAGNTNIMLVRDTISTPNSGFKAVVFSANSSASNYADATSPFNGVCEACHTLTSHYTNNSGGTSDARHVPATQKCTTCHPHDDAFYPQTNCLDCHKNVVGTRRQIVDANGDGSGTGGDFKRTSHHVTGSVPNVSDCILCHYMGDHKSGTVKLMDPDLGYLNVITYNPADKSTLEPFCIKCHDADGAGGDQTPFSDNVTVPVIDQTMWNASAHKGNANTNTCLSCHDNGHGSNKSTLIGPADYTGPGTGTDLMNEEEGFCLGCHGGTGVASVKVHLAFSSYTNTATRFFKHDPTATYRKHNNGENTGAAFGGTNRHVECVDCHNPHGAKAYAATTAPTIYNELIGASGVTPAYAGIGAPTGFTFNKNTTYEYEVCYKCHSSYTTLPTYLPDGIINGTTPTYQTDGLRKLTTSTNSQVPDWRDMARVFNPANLGYHPVMAAGKNTTLNVNTLQTGWTASSRMYCTSCHDNNNNGAGYGRGPHGSSNLHILDGTTNYTTAHGAAPTQTMNCINCHKVTSYITSNTNSGFGYHTTHYSQNATCYLCHNSHGGEIIHMINFSRNENVSCITAMTGTSQTAFTHATGGYNKSNCLITCHTEVHN